MKHFRILVLMHPDCVPPDSSDGYSAREINEWKTEYDVVSTLRTAGHEVRPLGVQEEIKPVRDAIEGFKPHIVFTLLEEFHYDVVYDQHIASYLELMKIPYTGCNPRGLILARANEELEKKLNSAVFPGLQGGPLMHVIAAKAVAFAEALRPDFKVYAKNVVENAKALAETLRSHGLDIVSGGTDNHLMLVDLRPKGLKGNISEKALVRAAITCNKNGIPFDPEKPFVTSGLRLGTPAATTRGFGVAEFKQVGGMIAEVLNALAQSPDGKAPLVEAAIKERVKALTDRFPIYQ